MTDTRAVVFRGPGLPLEVESKPVPTLEANQLSVRVTLAGVCGSDAHRLNGDIPAPAQPVNFGHEVVGVVEAVGSNSILDVTGAQIKPGDRLYWLPMARCGQCQACIEDRPIMECKNIDWPGHAGHANPAGFQELAVLTQQNYMVIVPERVTDESLMAFGCALPTALAAFRRLDEVPKTILIQGSGPVGLSLVVVAKQAAVRDVIVIGDPEPRLKWARRLGASVTLSLSDTTPEERKDAIAEVAGERGLPAVMEAAGHVSAIREGLSLLGDSGTYVIAGMFSGQGVVPTDFVEINNRNLTIKGSLHNNKMDYAAAVATVEELGGKLNFANMIDQVFPLDSVEQAIEAFSSGAVKVVIDPQA